MARFPYSSTAWCGLFLSCVWLQGSVAAAAGTDAVRLVDGGVLRGQIVRREANGGLLLAVRRAWLAEAVPRRAEAATAAEQRQSGMALEQLASRIDTLLNEPAGRFNEGLLAFLRREQARVADLRKAAEPDRPQFLWVAVPAAEVRAVVAADPDWRQLVQWGWHEDLANVETLPRPQLTRLLTARGIIATDRPPSLTDRLSPLPQDDAEWQARLALLEDAFGPAVRFQGTGDIVVRTDGEVTIDAILPVITQIVGGNLGSLFAPPDEDRHQDGPTEQWVAAARQQAATERRFRATRVQSSLEQGTVAVESVFEVRLPDRGWTVIWRDRLQLDATIPRAVAEEQIAADPRVGRALEAIKALGVFSDAALTKAIRFGAATLEAKQASDRRFDAFNSTFTARLDSPPLVVKEPSEVATRVSAE